MPIDKMPSKDSEINEDEIHPGGYFEPRAIEVKIGQHVDRVLKESRDNPEILKYSIALLKDIAEDVGQMAKQVSSIFTDRLKFIQGHIDNLENRDKKE